MIVQLLFWNQWTKQLAVKAGLAATFCLCRVGSIPEPMTSTATCPALGSSSGILWSEFMTSSWGSNNFDPWPGERDIFRERKREVSARCFGFSYQWKSGSIQRASQWISRVCRWAEWKCESDNSECKRWFDSELWLCDHTRFPKTPLVLFWIRLHICPINFRNPCWIVIISVNRMTKYLLQSMSPICNHEKRLLNHHVSSWLIHLQLPAIINHLPLISNTAGVNPILLVIDHIAWF